MDEAPSSDEVPVDQLDDVTGGAYELLDTVTCTICQKPVISMGLMRHLEGHDIP